MFVLPFREKYVLWQDTPESQRGATAATEEQRRRAGNGSVAIRHTPCIEATYQRSVFGVVDSIARNSPTMKNNGIRCVADILPDLS
jgi:hypothetical protein